MSAKLYFSNSPAVLLDKLSQNLEWADPFRPPHIATPTPAMKRWVQMGLADKRGIIANVDFMQLERTLWQRLEVLDLEHVVTFRKPARLLDEQGLQLLILGLLRRNPPPEAREYLDQPASGADREDLHARRLCQLSRKLAGFFREYEYSRVHEHGREGLAYLWKHDKTCFGDYLGKSAAKALRKQVALLETWQKSIYHDLFKQGGLRDALGESLGQYQYTLPQYAEMVLAQPRKPVASGRTPHSYHLFGLSQISPFHRSLITRLADSEALAGRHSSFFIYSLNPCAEYWEDVLTPRERRLRQQEDLFKGRKFTDWRQLEATEKNLLRLSEEKIQEEELHLEANENPLLSQWGKPGRENIQLWCQVTQYDFFEHFQERPSGTLLAAVQEALLHRRGRLSPEERVPQDDSLQILACPEIHREVETVHQGILDALIRDPSLRPDDIAVLVPDMGKYRHVLAAVFGRTEEGDPGHVPFNLSDASASAESDYARAVSQVFDLARGRFSRKEVFALAANPCFRSGLGLDEGMLKAWSGWTAKLNIFHGFDEADKRRRGYAAEGLHTWAHGLDRLILGTVMEAPGEDDLRHFEDIVPFADGNSQDREMLQGFLAVVQGLYRDLAPFREDRPRPWGEWLDILGGTLDRYLSPPADQPLEGYVEMELRRYLAELRSMDALDALTHAETGAPAGTGMPGIGAAIPFDLILSRLESLKAGREPHLSGGVNVAGLSALRSLPFRIVHVLGLGEGEFPEEDSASTLDLRRYRRVIGDVDPAGRNRYLFLETLVCCSAKLRLSYVSRDVQQGKAYQMCSVLNELKDYIEECVLAPEAGLGKPMRYRITQVPLLSRSPALFPADPADPADPAASAGSGAAAAARAPWDPPPNPFREEKILSWLEAKKAQHPDLAALLRQAPSMALRREIFPAAPVAARAEEIPARQSVAIDDLRLYLENPVLYTLRKRLGIRDRLEEDPMELEDEPFFSRYPKDLNLLEKVVQRRYADWEGAAYTTTVATNVATNVTATMAASKSHFLALYDNLALRGHMPGGHYSELDKELLWNRAEAVLTGLDGFHAKLTEVGHTLACIAGIAIGEGGSRGPQGRSDAPAIRIPPVRLRAAGREIELHGQLPCLFRRDADATGNGACSTMIFMSGAFQRRRLLPAFLFYVTGLLSDSPLGDWLRAAPFTVHYVHKKSSGSDAYEVANWAPFRMTRGEALAYLTGLLEAMLAGPDYDLLPFDLIAQSLTKGNRLVDAADFAQTLRDECEYAEEAADWAAFTSAYTPTESMRLLDPKVPEDAEAKIRARLASFFNFIPESHAQG